MILRGFFVFLMLLVVLPMVNVIELSDFESDNSWRHHEAYGTLPDGPQSHIDGLRILSLATKYEEELGTFSVFGEMLNAFQSPLTNVTLTVTFYDSAGTELGVTQAAPFLDYIRPGERSAFDAAAYGNLATKVHNFSYYRVSMSWTVSTATKPSLLDLRISSVVIDECGQYRIKGTAQNLGSKTLNNIVISAAFYNEKHQIITSAFTISKENSLRPAFFAPFELVIPRQLLGHYAYYSINAQSDNYSTRSISEHSTLPQSLQNTNLTSGSTSMTLYTDSFSYDADDNQIKVFGKVGKSLMENATQNSSLVLVSILGRDETELFRGSAPLASNGSFSKIVKFEQFGDALRSHDDFDNHDSQVFKITAKYAESTAENSFAVKQNDINDGGSSDGDISGECSNSPSTVLKTQVSINQANSGINNTSPEEYGWQDSMGLDQSLTLREFSADSPILIHAMIENSFSRVQPVTVIIQVFDQTGKVVLLRIEENTLMPNSINHLVLPWTPNEAGKYQLDTFSITNLEDLKILSSPTKISIDVKPSQS